MDKTAVTSYPVHELIARRWSPRAFAERPVEEEKLGSLFEAARWAASSYNEQPWRFFVATKGEPERFERLASCLVPGNRAWAERAPVLALSVARLAFTHNNEPNRHGAHDVGLSVAGLVLQAEALGLSVHQMAGFDAAKARQLLHVPDGFEPLAMMAIGYRGAPELLPDPLRAREQAPRERRPLSELVFGETWGAPLEALAEG